MNNNPLGVRKTMRLIIGLTILAWATQTLLHQWGYGADMPVNFGNTTVDLRLDEARTAGEIQPAEIDGRPQEKFVPGSARYLAGATLELRSEATIVGSEVKLRQICRWIDADKPAFEPIADLIVMRIGGSVPFRGLSLEELKQTLADAGVNMAVIHLAGATSCTIQRNDVKVDEHVALEQWIAARQAGTVATNSGVSATVASSITIATLAPAVAVTATADTASIPSSTPIAPAVRTITATASKDTTDASRAYHNLKELLTADLATRLSIPMESLQIKFNPTDDKLLALTEPLFKFNVDGRRARVLGDVLWEVTLVSDNGNKKTSVSAFARAYQNEMVVNRPLSYRQIIRDNDVVERHSLVDHLSDQPLLTREQVVGQLAGREMKAGTIVTAPLVEAVPLAKAGDLVSVTVEQGSVQIKTVGRAMESGAFGQSIKVKSETTRDVFVVTLTGPQAGRMSTGGSVTVTEPKVVSLEPN